MSAKATGLQMVLREPWAFHSVSLVKHHGMVQEYQTVLSPIATTLDKLQGEDNCYLALLMSTVQLVKKLSATLLAQLLNIVTDWPMVDGLITSLATCLLYLFDYSHN